jgi:hypothetical protein
MSRSIRRAAAKEEFVQKVQPAMRAQKARERQLEERRLSDQVNLMRRAHQYQHPEAFCIMQYRCTSEACNHSEAIWNSRDGVTPFTVGCPVCKGIMEHIYWDMDHRIIDYVPRDDQRVFIDVTEKHKRKYAESLLAQVRNDPNYRDQSDEELIKAFMGSFQPGEPTVVSGAEYLQLRREEAFK